MDDNGIKGVLYQMSGTDICRHEDLFRGFLSAAELFQTLDVFPELI